MASARSTLPLLAAGALAAAVLSSPASHAATGTPTFATPVVVDHFRPGFEPDVAVDKRPGSRGSAYVTWPFGFSTTQSFIERSDDGMHSFHLSEGNAIGKDAACVGGGDTEAILNQADGQFFFADLQGLTNFSNAESKDGGRTFTFSCSSVSGAGVDRQWLAVDNNGGTASVGAGANDARVYFEYDNVAQDVGDNQLVINESTNGTDYGSNLGCSTLTVCATPATVISGDEGLPGPVVVDNSTTSPFKHSVYVAHTNAAGTGFLLSICRPTPAQTTAATTADYCTDDAAFAPSDPARVSTHWHDVAIRAASTDYQINAFTVAAVDTAGNLYATWDELTNDTDGGRIYFAHSTDGGEHWSAPVRISGALGTNVFPWITAGSPGRAAIAWYGAAQAEEGGKLGPDTLDHGTWNVYLAQTLNGLATTPHFTTTKVSDHINKFGNISTQGLGGSPDRSLGDYLEVQQGARGEAIVSYVDDTSADRNIDVCDGCGQSPPEAAGPVMLARQTGGPSLLASVGTLSGPSDVHTGSVTDPTGLGYPDAFLSTATTDTNASANLDVKSVKITQPDADHLEVRLQVAQRELSGALSVSPTLGGSTADWLVRWAAPEYDKPGDGNIFYVGMESTGGQPPSFYTGSTASIDTTHAKYFVYPKDTTIPGKIEDDTIVWTVPLSDVGSPAKGQALYSVTGFTATRLGPSATTVTTPEGGELTAPDIPNLIDAAPPMTYVLGTKLTRGTGGSGGTGSGGGGSLATTGLADAWPALAAAFAALALVVARRRRAAMR